jgi:formylglycine-generating enzyme required for sulfatase activity
MFILLFINRLLNPIQSPSASRTPSQEPSLVAIPLDAATIKKHQQASAEDLGVSVEITNSIGMKLVLIPTGKFVMGMSQEENNRLSRRYPHVDREWLTVKHPPHRVSIGKPFYLGIHEVTRGQFRRFIEATEYETEAEKDGKGGYGWSESTGRFEGPAPQYSWRDAGFQQTEDHPVVNTTWNDARAFCEWLCKTEGERYRLPTEAEWEYACRAGTTTQYHSGDDPESLSLVGNVVDATARDKWTNYPDWEYISSRDGYVFTAPAGQFQPNSLGLYDMHGNVWEWCGDWYAEDYYTNSPPTDPQGPFRGLCRVMRGGSWGSGSWICGSAVRYWSLPSHPHDSRGFRVALDPPGEQSDSDRQAGPAEEPKQSSQTSGEDHPSE